MKYFFNTVLADWIRSKRVLRELIRKLITSIAIHRPGGKKDILLVSCRRSGSTWLMELLGASSGIRFVNEPFIPHLVAESRLPSDLDHLPIDERKVLEVPHSGIEAYRRHLSDYKSTRVRGPYLPFSPQFHLFSNRRVLKVVHATSIVEWMVSQNLNLDPLLLVRHPFANAVSMAKSNIALRSQANLKHGGFCKRYLSDKRVQLAKSILERGDMIECFVLEWCLDNIAIQEAHLNNPSWFLISYEELILQPARSLELIAEKFDVDTSKIKPLIETPSASTTPDRREAMKASEIKKLKRWQSLIDRQTEERFFSIIDEFGLSFYSKGRAIPNRPYLNFDSTEKIFEAMDT